MTERSRGSPMTFRSAIGRHRGQLAGGAVLTGAAGLVATLPPLFLGQIVDLLGRAAALDDVARLAGLLVLTSGIRATLQASARYLVIGSGRDLEYELRNDLFGHLQLLHVAWYQQQRIGDLMARMTNDLNAVRMMVSGGYLNLVGSLTTLAFTVAAMATLSLRLTAVSLALIPFVVIAFFVVGRRVQRRFSRLQAQFGALSTGVQENLSGIRVLKAFGQEQAEMGTFAGLNQEYVDRAIGLARFESVLWPLTDAILGLAVLLVLYVGGQDSIAGDLSLGQLVQFVAYFNLLSGPVTGLGWTMTLFQSGAASLGRLAELSSAKPRIASPTQPVERAIAGEVELRDVSVAYSGRPVLERISLRVAPGGRLGIVGATGAGKSTLVNLIPRLLDADSGQVLVDGMDVRTHDLRTLRGAIGVVPQEPFLFSATIRDNIGLGLDAPLDDASVSRAAEVAQLAGDVATFTDKYDTVIGERGVTLSGGQRQRAAIARAIATNPRILILDDALSAVDTHTESEILRGLRGVMVGRTSIVVAHRISSVMDADEIVVLDEGRIVERGTHADLLARRGPYARMHRRQMLREETEQVAGLEVAGVGDGLDPGPRSASLPEVEPPGEGGAR